MWTTRWSSGPGLRSVFDGTASISPWNSHRLVMSPPGKVDAGMYVYGGRVGMGSPAHAGPDWRSHAIEFRERQASRRRLCAPVRPRSRFVAPVAGHASYEDGLGIRPSHPCERTRRSCRHEAGDDGMVRECPLFLSCSDSSGFALPRCVICSFGIANGS